MKTLRRALSLLALGAMGLASANAQSLEAITAHFAQPPDSAKPWVWWHWMNGNISAEGITKDLEALKTAGFGGVVLFEESDRIPPGSVVNMSPEHLALVAHAGRECARLHLDFAFQNCPGWSSTGGPWITPEQAMKHVTWSEQTVEGGKTVDLALERPSTVVRPFKDLGPPSRYAEHDYYRDVAVLAFPSPKNPAWRLTDWEKKMDYLTGYNLRDERDGAGAGAVIDKHAIIVLTDQMDANGHLRWTPPAGAWTIVRFGYTLTEHTNRAAPTTGTGLEADKFSREAVDFHWAHFEDKVLAAAGSSGKSPVTAILTDSYEPLTQTWTPKLPEEFQRRRAYELFPYLLCLTGRPVGSVEESERFLWDYRRTLADLMADNYYGELARKSHERGLAFGTEGYGYYGTLFDDFQVATEADIPMGEFWAGVIKWHHWSGKIAASAADIFGRHLVGAEAYTAGNDMAAWRWHPYTLKAQGDYFFCRGVTRFYIQASAHQPWDDRIRPGMTMGPNGIQMNRNNTWFAQSRDWVAYLARSQYVLQQGQLVTDIYYDYGDNAPGTMRPNASVADKGPKGVPWSLDVDVSPAVWTALPAGRDFHVGNGSVIERMRVNARGELELPNGQTYQLLLLPDDDRMRLDQLEKIASLVEAGATVVGPRPVKSPSLQDRGQDDRIKALAQRLWADIDGKSVTSHPTGKGAVYYGVGLEEVLRRKRLPPDFEYHGIAATGAKTESAPRLDYLHRRLPDGEVYFVSNQRNEPASVECVFRARSELPLLLHPETGAMEPATVWHALPDGRAAVDLNLAPAESCFVVFRPSMKATPVSFTTFAHDGHAVTDPGEATIAVQAQSTTVTAFVAGAYTATELRGAQRKATVSALPAALDLSDAWQVAFPAGWGAPAAAVFPRLASFTENAEAGIKYFSGTATYTRSFELPAEGIAAGRRAVLDLGDVQVIAELAVNGRDCGILWKPPFRRDITTALRPGHNTVTVKVTNLWRNRLIGDAKTTGFSAAAAARMLDPMLAGNTKAVQSAGKNKPAPPGEEFYVIPDWVRKGEANPDPRVFTFTPFAFLTGETPLVPSGLIGPVHLVWGQTVPLNE